MKSTRLFVSLSTAIVLGSGLTGHGQAHPHKNRVSLDFTATDRADSTPDFQVLATYDYPVKHSTTTGAGINDKGFIVGHAASFTFPHLGGFLRYPNGRLVTPIVEPNDDSGNTLTSGINNDGVICGQYFSTSDQSSHGFLLQDGVYTEFNVDGTEPPPCKESITPGIWPATPPP